MIIQIAAAGIHGILDLKMISWNAGPEIFRLGPITLRWYGVLFAFGFWLCYQLYRKFFIAEKKPLARLDSFFIHMVLGTLIGARLGHCLFYEPDVYLPQPWRILAIWEGGLASHGGLTGIWIGTYLFCRKHREFRYFWLMDRVAIVAPLGGALIRIGNFFNSEIVGRVTDLPWAVRFLRLDGLPRHPAQLYESLCGFAVFFFLSRVYWRNRHRADLGWFSGMYLILIFSSRFAIEFIKENQVAFENTLPLNMGQLLSLPLIGGGIWLARHSLRNSKNPPQTQRS